MSDSKPILRVIVASVRDGRKGRAVADWFVKEAQKHTGFDVRMTDLKELDLPLMTEPNHPRMQDYTQEKTWEWSRIVDESDTFAFVMPEYNYTPNAPLVNALDYLYKEWQYKPAVLVSYGGISGGMRAAQTIKLQMTTLNMVPLPGGVTIPNFSEYINDSGEFVGYEQANESVESQLNELMKWNTALSSIRNM